MYLVARGWLDPIHSGVPTLSSPCTCNIQSSNPTNNVTSDTPCTDALNCTQRTTCHDTVCVTTYKLQQANHLHGTLKYNYTSTTPMPKHGSEGHQNQQNRATKIISKFQSLVRSPESGAEVLTSAWTSLKLGCLLSPRSSNTTLSLVVRNAPAALRRCSIMFICITAPTH